jgi:hypothetical protein
LAAATIGVIRETEVRTVTACRARHAQVRLLKGIKALRWVASVLVDAATWMSNLRRGGRRTRC